MDDSFHRMGKSNFEVVTVSRNIDFIKVRCINLKNFWRFGERPYWWSLEQANAHAVPHLKQFPVTCETGPGSPSGHAMITAAIFYIICDYISTKKRILHVPIWTSYVLMIVSVSISRLYIAAHFPHQGN